MALGIRIGRYWDWDWMGMGFGCMGINWWVGGCIYYRNIYCQYCMGRMYGVCDDEDGDEGMMRMSI